MNRNRKNKIISSILLFSVAAILLIAPFYRAQAINAQAMNISDVGLGFIGKLLNGVLQSIIAVLAWLLSLSGLLLDAFFSIEQYSEAPLVIEGWKLVRDFANMFFAFILLIMAFATILGMETYGLKKLLPKLIIVALLINFSLFIAGAIVDFSQVFLHYFVDVAKETGGKNVSITIVEKMALSQLAKPEEAKGWWKPIRWLLEKGAVGPTGQLVAGIIEWKSLKTEKIVLISSIFSIILLFLAIFVFLGGFLLLFIRMMTLWALMISAPIVWLASILPYTAKYVGQWWESLIKQCIVGPVYFFFVYLVILFVRGDGLEKMATAAISGGAGSLLLDVETIRFVFQYITIIFIMGMGLIVAPQLGGKGAASAIGLAHGWQKKATGWARIKGVERPLQTVAHTQTFQKIGRALDKVPFLKYAGGAIIGAAERSKEVLTADAAKYKEMAKHYSKDNVLAELERAEGSKAVGFLQTATEEGYIKGTDPLAQQKIRVAARFGLEKEILEVLPSLAKELGRNIEEIVRKMKDASKIQKDEILNIPEVFEALKNRYQEKDGLGTATEIRNIIQNNPALHQKIFTEYIVPELNIAPEFRKIRTDIQQWAQKTLAKGLFTSSSKPPRRGRR